MNHLNLEDGTICYEERGNGPALLFLHGWTLDQRLWQPQLKAFSGQYRVITIDRRGFGNSTAPPDLDCEPEDILRLLDHLKISRCALVGMSQGGRIALRFARRHPEKLSGLVLQSAPLDDFLPPPRKEERIPLNHYAELVRTGNLEEMKRLWAGHPIMHGEKGSVGKLIAEILADYQGRDLLAPRKPPTSSTPPLAGELDRIATPTLIINGERDTDWLKLVGRVLAYGLPGARRLVIEGAGHFANLSHAEDYNRALLSFFMKCLKK